MTVGKFFCLFAFEAGKENRSNDDFDIYDPSGQQSDSAYGFLL
jgi:hypothetical protein